MQTKYCPSCNIHKGIPDFYKSKDRGDGLQGRCKNCLNKLTRAYIASPAGKITQKRYKQSKKGKKSACEHRKRHDQKYPEKVKARKRIETAKKNGTLPYPSSLNCAYCFNKAKHYHHYRGYEVKYWLTVEPVCIGCHKKIHEGYIMKRISS